LLRAPPVLVIFYQIANAKSESATLRANMSGVITKRRLRARGSQGVLDPLAPFFRPFLGRAKKGHQKPNSERARSAG
jgi:hypothetical protein